VRTPSWDESREFLRVDGWTADRSTAHDFFEKALPDGEILRPHASRSGLKTISPGRFKAILSDQLHLGEAEFWEVLRSRTPARRPSRAPEPAPASLPLWIAAALERELGLDRSQIARPDDERAHPGAGGADLAMPTHGGVGRLVHRHAEVREVGRGPLADGRRVLPDAAGEGRRRSRRSGPRRRPPDSTRR